MSFFGLFILLIGQFSKDHAYTEYTKYWSYIVDIVNNNMKSLMSHRISQNVLFEFIYIAYKTIQQSVLKRKNES